MMPLSRLSQISILSLSSVFFSACGGGGDNADTTPDDFSFTAETGVVLNSTRISAPITVAGISEMVPITITNGTYRIDGGSFTSAEGQVGVDQRVEVQVMAAAELNTPVEATVTIGGVSAIYRVTTLADNTAPTAAIVFPPPSSMTEGTTITVRGTATDDLSAITNIQVDGVDVTDTSSDGSYATWRVSVTLPGRENTLTVTTEDASGNTNNNAASVSVRSDVNLGDFPDSNVALSWPIAVVADHANGRLLIGDRDLDAIVTMDLATGARGILSDSSTANILEPLDGPEGLLVDSDNNRVMVVDILSGTIFEVDLTTGVRSVVSDATTPNNENSFIAIRSIIDVPGDPSSWLVADSSNGLRLVSKADGARTIFSMGRGASAVPDTVDDFSSASGIVHDVENNRYLVVDRNRGVVEVDPVTGARTYFSSNTVPNAEAPLLDDPRSGVLDYPRNRLLVSNSEGTNTIIAVDLDTGIRSVFSDSTTPNALNLLSSPQELFYDGTYEYMFLVDRDLDGVLAIDIDSGERVYVSRGDSVD